MGILLFVLKYIVYFLASEDDKWGFLIRKNHGQFFNNDADDYHHHMWYDQLYFDISNYLHKSIGNTIERGNPLLEMTSWSSLALTDFWRFWNILFFLFAP